jgi:hypothetical protein
MNHQFEFRTILASHTNGSSAGDRLKGEPDVSRAPGAPTATPQGVIPNSR